MESMSWHIVRCLLRVYSARVKRRLPKGVDHARMVTLLVTIIDRLVINERDGDTRITALVPAQPQFMH